MRKFMDHYAFNLRIPDQGCHWFQTKPATHSTRKLPLIPRQSCHPGRLP